MTLKEIITHVAIKLEKDWLYTSLGSCKSKGIYAGTI